MFWPHAINRTSNTMADHVAHNSTQPGSQMIDHFAHVKQRRNGVTNYATALVPHFV
jgi:hypothetical protein